MKQNSIYAFSSYSKIASLKCHLDCNSLFLLDIRKTQLSPTEHLVKKKTQEVQSVADFSPWL